MYQERHLEENICGEHSIAQLSLCELGQAGMNMQN